MKEKHPPISSENILKELNLSKKKVQILETVFNDLLEELKFSRKQFQVKPIEDTSLMNRSQSQLILSLIDDLFDEIRLAGKQIQSLESDIGHVIDGIFEGDRGDELRAMLVRVMNLSLSHWESTSELSKIELAEESGIWKVTIDQGVLRVRTLDRYLQHAKLPKNPKWRDVVRTARFVLNHNDQPSSVKSELESKLQDLQDLIHVARSHK